MIYNVEFREAIQWLSFNSERTHICSKVTDAGEAAKIVSENRLIVVKNCDIIRCAQHAKWRQKCLLINLKSDSF
jgi:hypothetical protein